MSRLNNVAVFWDYGTQTLITLDEYGAMILFLTGVLQRIAVRHQTCLVMRWLAKYAKLSQTWAE